MGLFFFHIRDGEYLVSDDEGMLLSDAPAVEDEARLSASDIARQYMLANKSLARLKIEDERGGIVVSKRVRDALH